MDVSTSKEAELSDIVQRTKSLIIKGEKDNGLADEFQRLLNTEEYRERLVEPEFLNYFGLIRQIREKGEEYPKKFSIIDSGEFSEDDSDDYATHNLKVKGYLLAQLNIYKKNMQVARIYGMGLIMVPQFESILELERGGIIRDDIESLLAVDNRNAQYIFSEMEKVYSDSYPNNGEVFFMYVRKQISRGGGIGYKFRIDPDQNLVLAKPANNYPQKGPLRFSYSPDRGFEESLSENIDVLDRYIVDLVRSKIKNSH